MLPVEQVTWKEAVEFCNEFRIISGLHTVLPTEAEWEYACRAGSESAYSFGNIIHPEDANYDDSRRARHGPNVKLSVNPYPVGSFEPNKWGFLTCTATLPKWCRDSLPRSGNQDSATPSGSPELGENAAESEIETSRVFRAEPGIWTPVAVAPPIVMVLTPTPEAYYLGFRMVIEP